MIKKNWKLKFPVNLKLLYDLSQFVNKLTEDQILKNHKLQFVDFYRI